MGNQVTERNGDFYAAAVVSGCCFCGKEPDDDLVHSIVLCEPSGEEHTWWCHKECFIEALHPEYRLEPGD